ncbi:hypothetical protein Y5S_00752 [Alcanivorax nanhaiticus]|uniref:Uncharacterized protein n=1 Tax=Alcanivorax nanhaiticus TaxID=1177154 RepID=A0A095UUR9_9GAMM|nr:hypothetical protein Y5S_00752 [Alcanivorax nanhaiticus]
MRLGIGGSNPLTMAGKVAPTSTINASQVSAMNASPGFQSDKYPQSIEKSVPSSCILCLLCR